MFPGWGDTGFGLGLSERARYFNHNKDLFNGPKFGENGFQVCLNLPHFEPNEVSVKVVNDDTVLVEAKQGDMEDNHDPIYRHYIRDYKVPKEYNLNCVTATFSIDGVLTIKAPLANERNERLVNIIPTGPAHLWVRPNPPA